jgi:hypothetical protein
MKVPAEWARVVRSGEQDSERSSGNSSSSARVVFILLYYAFFNVLALNPTHCARIRLLEQVRSDAPDRLAHLDDRLDKAKGVHGEVVVEGDARRHLGGGEF